MKGPGQRDLSDGPEAAAEDLVERLERGLAVAAELRDKQMRTRGLIHDLNNLLAALASCVDFLLLNPDERPARSSMANDMLSTVRRASALSRRLERVWQPEVGAPDVLDVHAHLRGIRSVLDEVLGDGIGLELQLASDSPNVRADASRLDQLLLNLIVNARDAMPDGGTVRITTEVVPAERPEGADPAAGTASVRMVVEDDGEGMDEATLGRSFMPLFSSKTSGSGLGLGICCDVVGELRGRIDVSSEPGEGTRFIIDLPLCSSGGGSAD